MLILTNENVLENFQKLGSLGFKLPLVVKLRVVLIFDLNP